MKILLLNTVYKTGSTGKIVQNLHKFLLKKGHESIVCYGEGKPYNKDLSVMKISSTFEIYLHAFFTRLFGLQGTYSYFATKKLLRLIKRFHPDIVHLFSLHGYYINEFKLFKYLKENNVRTVYSMIDEYPYMGKCCYSYECTKFETKCNHCPQVRDYPKSLWFDRSSKLFELKKDAYNNFTNIIFTGPKWVIDRAKKSALIGDRNFSILDEFTNVNDVFYPRDTSRLRSILKIPIDKKIILNVASYSIPRKGGIYYLNIARLLDKENIVFIHVGYDGDTSNLPDNFIPINYVSNQDELAEYYSLADLFVCTSLADTMPNVCLEALSCGTPLCGFAAGGTPFVTTSELGNFTPTFDILSLSSVIKSAPYKTKEKSLACRAYAEMRYSSNLFCSKVMELYTEAINLN